MAGVSAALFRFESGPYLELKCIPMVVRYKLDMVGIKLSLRQWNRLPAERREALITGWPVDTEAQRERLGLALQEWVLRYCGEAAAGLSALPDPVWLQKKELCPEVRDAGSLCNPPLRVEEWEQLSLMQRFALVKLALSRHERERFGDALEEFRAERNSSRLVEASY